MGMKNISPTLFLLSGPPGMRRDYCREFLEEGLGSKKRCIFLSSKITDKENIELFDMKGGVSDLYLSILFSYTRHPMKNL